MTAITQETTVIASVSDTLIAALDRHANARDDSGFLGYVRSFIKSRHPVASAAKTGGSIQFQIIADSSRVDWTSAKYSTQYGSRGPSDFVRATG